MTPEEFYGAIDRCSQTHEWDGTDSRKRYKSNSVKQLHQLEKFGWVGAKITYDFNSYGFRSAEFEEGDGIVFLGCSHTFGAGLPKENTFADIVAKHFNLANYNLGIPGGSMGTCFKLAYYWIPILKPKYVVLASPDRTRFSILKSGGYEDHLKASHIESREYKDYSRFYKRYINNDYNPGLDYFKNLYGIKYICSQHNIPIVDFEINKLYDSYDDQLIKRDYARDLQHRGVKTHKRVADMIVKQIDKS
jgi:hypothetical protein